MLIGQLLYLCWLAVLHLLSVCPIDLKDVEDIIIEPYMMSVQIGYFAIIVEMWLLRICPKKCVFQTLNTSLPFMNGWRQLSAIQFRQRFVLEYIKNGAHLFENKCKDEAYSHGEVLYVFF